MRAKCSFIMIAAVELFNRPVLMTMGAPIECQSQRQGCRNTVVEQCAAICIVQAAADCFNHHGQLQILHRSSELEEKGLVQHYSSFQKAPLRSCMPRWCFLTAMRALPTPHLVKGCALQTHMMAAQNRSAQSVRQVRPCGSFANVWKYGLWDASSLCKCRISQ